MDQPTQDGFYWVQGGEIKEPLVIEFDTEHKVTPLVWLIASDFPVGVDWVKKWLGKVVEPSAA